MSKLHFKAPSVMTLGFRLEIRKISTLQRQHSLGAGGERGEASVLLVTPDVFSSRLCCISQKDGREKHHVLNASYQHPATGIC